MAAANTDKLRKKKSNFSTTLNGGIDDNDTTITLNSTSGLATDTAITLTINRVDANGNPTPSAMERVTGVVSGSNLTNVVRAEDGTSAKSHLSGAVVEDIWEADGWNDAVDAFLTEHTQSGAHEDISAESINVPVSYGGITTDVDGSTITFDMSVSNKHEVVLGGNRTLAVSNMQTGQILLVKLKQDGSGNRTVTWFSDINWDGAITPILSSTAAHWDYFAILKTGSSEYDGFVLGQDFVD